MASFFKGKKQINLHYFSYILIPYFKGELFVFRRKKRIECSMFAFQNFYPLDVFLLFSSLSFWKTYYNLTGIELFSLRLIWSETQFVYIRSRLNISISLLIRYLLFGYFRIWGTWIMISVLIVFFSLSSIP